MNIRLHANATTTPKTRRYIQEASKPVAALAREFGVSVTGCASVDARQFRPPGHITLPVRYMVTGASGRGWINGQTAPGPPDLGTLGTEVDRTGFGSLDAPLPGLLKQWQTPRIPGTDRYSGRLRSSCSALGCRGWADEVGRYIDLSFGGSG
jgi:hypothetical protein